MFSYDKQQVSDITYFVRGSLITSFSMTNSLWVTLHILWKVVLSHLFLLQTACEWHHTFCEWQSHQSYLWPTGCEWHCTFCERQSHYLFLPMMNSLWVTLHILWKTVSSYSFLFDQQAVSTITHCLTFGILTISPLYCIIYIYQKVSMFPYLVHVLLYIIIIIDCKISFQLIHCYIMWSIFSSISRWVILVHEVMIFILVCMLVCRSDDILDIYSIS